VREKGYRLIEESSVVFRCPVFVHQEILKNRGLSAIQPRLAFMDKRDDTERGESACDPCACFQFGNFATSLNRKAVFSPFAPIICAAANFFTSR